VLAAGIVLSMPSPAFAAGPPTLPKDDDPAQACETKRVEVCDGYSD